MAGKPDSLREFAPRGLHQDGHSCFALQTLGFKQTRPRTTKGKARTAAAGPARSFFSVNQRKSREQWSRVGDPLA
jgi:hypothetical protein